MVPRDPGEVFDGKQGSEDLPSQGRLRAVGLSEGCPRCRYLRTGQGRHEAHSEACRKRIEGLLKGDSSGSARLAAADERINRALADAVERRWCCLSSRIGASEENCDGHRAGLDTTPFSLLRRIISIRCTTSITTSIDQNIGTGDVARETRTGPMQDVTRASSSDDIGDDVVMRDDNADEHRAEYPSSSGSDGRRRITTKREPREVRDAQTSVTEQPFPRRISGETTLSEHPVAVTTQEASDVSREKSI